MSPSDKKLKATKKALVVCGPTASGKSELSDALAEELTEAHGERVPTLVVDAMQVYREIPTITNQARRRPAELVGIVSVTEEWTVAGHKARAEEIIEGVDTPFVLDAGTGMYLNAIILDVPLAPKVDAKTRQLAKEITATASNPRRASRAKELELAGAQNRGSIWDGELRYDTAMIYLRPNRETLDAAIAKRSQRIVSGGLEEAAKIKEMEEAGAGINPSVADSIGVRELIEHLRGDISLQGAQTQITARTRKLARRQMRWFDKLARTLEGRTFIEIVESPSLNSMHDRIWA
jgi:tRNA dimethylallyltransferase